MLLEPALALPHEGQVLLINLGLHPDRGEVSQPVDAFPGLHHLADHGHLLHDHTVRGCAIDDGPLRLARLTQFGNELLREIEELQARERRAGQRPAFGPFRAHGEQVVELRVVELGRVDFKQGITGLHRRPGRVDVQLFEPAFVFRGDVPQPLFVVNHCADGAQFAAHRPARNHRRPQVHALDRGGVDLDLP